MKNALLIPSMEMEINPELEGEMSELVGATQLCPARQKMPRLDLSEGGIQTPLK